MDIPPIFKDKKLQDLFDKNGFVVVPFLEDQEINKLNQLFDELHPQLPDNVGFVSSSYSNDFDYKKKASDLITQIFKKHYNNLFINFQPFGAAFLFKMPSENSELGVHQDWTIVDEEKYVALNCWVPLTDITSDNGALHVLSGSQYSRIKTLRAPTIPFFFTGNESMVIEQSKPFYVKAGQAVILNQSVIHFSPPNKSNKIRKAITAGIKTKGAPMLFHFLNEANIIYQYLMPEDFLIRFENFSSSIFSEPKLGEKTCEINYVNPIMNAKRLATTLAELKQSSFLEKLTHFFQNR